MQCFFKMPCLIQCKTWKNSTWGWVNNVWIFILGQTIPLRLGVCLNLVIMMQTELIKRGRWSSICRTQTCRQASACVRPPPPHKDTSWSIPALTYSRTNSYVTLTDLWPSTLTEPAEREGHHQRGETRQRPVTHPGESHIYLSWMQMTRFGYKLRSQNRGDA